MRARYWIMVAIAGGVLRLALLPASARWGFEADHDQFCRWAIQATDRGLVSVYDAPPPKWNLRSTDGQIRQRAEDERCNYPPLAVYLLYLSGVAFKALSADRLINTTLSHCVLSGWSIGADFLLAWGCAAVVAHFRPGRAPWWAFTAVLLAPPVWWDSVMWGQVDSWVLAPAVWMVWAVLRQRWILAGALYGLAAGLKPQALLLLPFWGLVLVTSATRGRVLLAGVVAAATLGLAALPFMVHSGWTWLGASYGDNLWNTPAFTSQSAFNIWYVDQLLNDVRDSSLAWFGLQKDIWGRALLAAALLAGLTWVAVRWRRDQRGLLIWAALSLLAAVMLPTRVHERYLILSLPFLIILAVLYARFAAPAAALAIVMLAQMTWPHWIAQPPATWGDYQEPEARKEYRKMLVDLPPKLQAAAPSYEEFTRDARQQFAAERARTAGIEWTVTLLALLASAGTVVAAASVRPSGAGEAKKSTPAGGKRRRAAAHAGAMSRRK